MTHADAATQRRILLQALIDQELPSHTSISIIEPQSSIVVIVCTLSRTRRSVGAGPEAPIDLHEQVRIADYWVPDQIRAAIAEAADTLRKRSGRA
jgi:hypothetical protein